MGAIRTLMAKPARQREDGEHALGSDVVALEGLAHQGGADAFIDVGGAAAVVGDHVAGPEELAVLGGRGAEACHARSAARDVEAAHGAAKGTVPDAAPVAGVLAALVGMLELQVARRHVGVGEPVAGLREATVCLVPFVDDLQAEGVEQGVAERGRQPVRMTRRKQADLAREGEVEIDDLAVASAAGGIGDDRTRRRARQGMAAVDRSEACVVGRSRTARSLARPLARAGFRR